MSSERSVVAVAHPLRTPSVLGVLLAAWLGASTFLLGYPFTIDGQDAALRDRGLTLALLLTGACWFRATRHRRLYLGLFALFAAVLVVESLAFAYGPLGSLAWPWWNEKITGVLMIACAAVGWRRAPAVEQGLRTQVPVSAETS